MLRTVGNALRAAAAVWGLTVSASQAQPIDRWHYITRESVLFADRVAGLHGAGVIQADEIFAMLYLGLPEENGVVSIVLPTPDPAERLTSVLVSPSGQRFERNLSAQELDTAPVGSGRQAYSFPITDEDVDLFKSATAWELRIGDTVWSISLDGSRRAIELAEAERARQLSELTRELVPTD
ncbi:hypothetical protein [Aestuariivita sp.]|uniref:hypothetical protein n=1 Tax=Aestuariivita sp. TaxID=1872407 RepID=UPI00217486BB|nr:hypothetical protein [Aestuariivita sp.]MCE8006292.1 hypothetical protein [Aestuariivita sp.]